MVPEWWEIEEEPRKRGRWNYNHGILYEKNLLSIKGKKEFWNPGKKKKEKENRETIKQINNNKKHTIYKTQETQTRTHNP